MDSNSSLSLFSNMSELDEYEELSNFSDTYEYEDYSLPKNETLDEYLAEK